MEILSAKTENQLEKIENLYEKSFPKEEKKPFSLILQKQKEKTAEIFSLESRGNFVGLMIVGFYKNFVFLDYFAIDCKNQSKGLGSEAISLLRKKFPDKKIFLEIESAAKNAPNAEQRQKRKNFYLKNGFSKLPFEVNLFNVEMEILSSGKSPNFQEYLEIYEKIYGPEILKNISLAK